MFSRNSEEIVVLRPKLFKAAKSGNVKVLHQILDPGQVSGENDLRIALQKAAEAGNEEAVKVLLGKGAKTDVITNKGLSPLHRAVERGHTGIITLLLDHGASTEIRDHSGRTVYIWAALRGQNSILEFLRQKYHADINAVDQEGRTALHTLAADSHQPPQWNDETVRILLSAGIDLDKVDNVSRTALHWAAATGKVSLAAKILKASAGRSLTMVRATTDRGKTALHLAAENNHVEMARLLLRNGALKEATSDGNWTALLNAAKEGNEEMVDLLLRHSSNPNSRTSSGRMALHWAADQGHLRVVGRILVEPTSLKNAKDNSDKTPFSLAAQKGHREIMQILQPYVHDRGLSGHAKHACEGFTAAVVDFFRDPNDNKASNKVQRKSVYDVLYSPKSKSKPSKGESTDRSSETTKDRFLVSTSLKMEKADFRWIHLPANNVDWAEALITKYFIEHGDLAVYQSLLQSLGDQQHRGPQAHSFYMRPVFEEVLRNAAAPPRQQNVESEGLEQPSVSMSPKPDHPKTGARHEARSKVVGQLSVPTPRKIDHSTTSSKSNSGSPKNVFVLFMPYLHWETDENRAWTSRTIMDIQDSRVSSSGPLRNQEESLLRGYLPVKEENADDKAAGGLHIRRTLDQFHHQTVKTDHRDRDQVVLRYCARKKIEQKIFMVDELWMWIIGDSLVFTCFPERAHQPKNDPLNVFGGIIENLNSKRIVGSTHELAVAITNRCIGTFARHQPGLQEFSFLEMIDMTIGTLTRRETALFQRFQKDAAIVAGQLTDFGKLSHIFNDTYASAEELTAFDAENEEDEWLADEWQGQSHQPHIIDRLWSVAKEAKLIVECKDILDELGMLTTVFNQGQQVLRDMEGAFRGLSALGDETKTNLSKSFAQQQKMVDSKLLDINRMEKAVKSVYDNLFEVLDLKQKHANSIEVRISRERALEATQQGRTIMVFTIVTIIFLPMSFLAAFFTIDIVEFPYASNGAGLHLGFVSKYIFGIGMAVSIPLIAMALIFGRIQDWLTFWRSIWSGRKTRDRAERIGRTQLEESAPGDDRIRISSESFRTRALKAVKNEGLVLKPDLAIEELRHSADWSIGSRLSRINTGKTDRSRFSQDLEIG